MLVEQMRRKYHKINMRETNKSILMIILSINSLNPTVKRHGLADGTTKQDLSSCCFQAIYLIVKDGSTSV